MPIYMDILHIERLVMIVARGRVTADEIAENTKALLEANVPGFSKIIDVAGASSDLTREQVHRIADMLRGRPDGTARGPVAFVINPARQGFAQAFADLTRGDRPIELFASLHAARSWLEQARADPDLTSPTLHHRNPVRR